MESAATGVKIGDMTTKTDATHIQSGGVAMKSEGTTETNTTQRNGAATDREDAGHPTMG